MARHYFIETDDTLTQKTVGSSNMLNGYIALRHCADRRYGKAGWSVQRQGHQLYVRADDGRCLAISPRKVA